MPHAKGIGMPSNNRGFTLVEAIVVIVLLAIIAVSMAVYVKQPAESYLLTVRRVALTEQAAVSYTHLRAHET